MKTQALQKDIESEDRLVLSPYKEDKIEIRAKN